MNVRGLLDKAKSPNGLTPQEIVLVYTRLTETADNAERYTALHMLGIMQSVEYRSAVEAFLEWPEYPAVSGMALKVLCSHWNLMDDYLHQVRRFLDGVAWDYEDDCRLSAIYVCGDYLREKECVDLLKRLLDIFMDASMRLTIRGAAYEQMGRALDVSWNDLLAISDRKIQRGEIDWSIIDRVKERLLSQSGKRRKSSAFKRKH